MIEKHQVYGLATPEDFTLPPHHPLWTTETYTAFEVSSEASEKYDTKVSGVLVVVGWLYWCTARYRIALWDLIFAVFEDQ